MGATPVGYRSIVGKRFGLLGNGMISVDGKTFKGEIPSLGTDYFVHSGTGSDSSDGLTPDRAVATLDTAFGTNYASENQGDRIIVLPGHSETITGAAGIAHDVAGVSVIGVGHGGQRPTFLMDASTAVTYKITANDALVHNLAFNSGNSDVVTCIDVQTATDAWIDGCHFGDNTTNENFLTCIKSGTSTDNQCDGLKVTNCTWLSVDAGSLEFIEVLGNLDRFTVKHNTVVTAGTGLASLIVVTDGDSVFTADIGWNKLVNKDAADGITLFITDQSDNSGFAYNNYLACLDVLGELVATATSGLFFYENRTASVGGTTGYVLPGADS